MKHAVVTVAAVLLGALSAGEVEAQPRICIRATMDEPFRLPDGSRHSAGLLRVCVDRDLAPAISLHTLNVEDGFSGRFVSWRHQAEATMDAGLPRLVFARDASGLLSLRACALIRDGRNEVFWIESPPGGRAWTRGLLVATEAP